MGSAEDKRTERERSLAKGEVDIVVVGAVGVVEEIEAEIEAEIEVEIAVEIGAETELESDALDHFHVHLLHCRKLEKHGVWAERDGSTIDARGPERCTRILLVMGEPM